jgi:hypothetical protein
MGDLARTVVRRVRLNPKEDKLVEQAVAADEAADVGSWMREKVLAAAKRSTR